MDTATPLGIELCHVRHRFGTKWVLQDVNLEVARGEIVGLLGPNGAGKSTTMKIITSNLVPTEGRVRVNGEMVTQDRATWRKGLGYLPEQNPLYPELLVDEYLNYVCKLYGVQNPKQAKERVLSLVGLTHVRTRRVGHLSKGYKQRVGLAATLVAMPQTLVLDEPTNGLDPNQLLEIRALIRNLKEEHAILLSTHIMQEVEAMCDRVVILHEGKIVASGRTEHIVAQRGKGEIIVGFAAGQGSQQLLQSWCKQSVVKPLKDNQYSVSYEDYEAQAQHIFEQCVAHNVVLTTLSKKSSQLEDIFHEYTQDASHTL